MREGERDLEAERGREGGRERARERERGRGREGERERERGREGGRARPNYPYGLDVETRERERGGREREGERGGRERGGEEGERVSNLLIRQGRLGDVHCSGATISPRRLGEFYAALYRVSRRVVSLGERGREGGRWRGREGERERESKRERERE